MKQRLPLAAARLDASEAHVEAFKALAHLTRLQIFFYLVREAREVAVATAAVRDALKR